jgi:ABC-type lipoprotein export system ATPase subunit
MALLHIDGLQKAYVGPDGSRHQVVDIPRFELAEGAAVALAGPSGSGKTTFLNLVAGILAPDAGHVRIDGTDVAQLPEHERDRFRARHVGYIFQTFNLLQGFTCLENVLLGMSFGHGIDRARAEALLRRVGLGERLHHFPRQLSTGQQQRVAVARALAGKPRLVLADEPTGNLDPRHAQEALALIREVCAENGSALLLVSHDRDILARFGMVASLADINRASRATSSGGAS